LLDPIEHRNAERVRQRLDTAKAITFKECAESYIKAHRAGWRNAKHAGQWDATLATYAYPHIDSLSVQAIDTALVMKILEQPAEKDARCGRRGRKRRAAFAGEQAGQRSNSRPSAPDR